MAVVSAELPMGRVFEIAGPLVTARCTSVCRIWREAADESHVWRVHVETTCGRVVATALDELQREGRTSLTFKELIIKRWRSNHITAASAYTWTQVAPFRADSTQNERDERKEELRERFRVVLLEASLVHRQTGARMAFVTVPMDETHIRRLTVMCDMPWPKGRTTASMPSIAAQLMPLWPGDHTLEIMTDTFIEAMIESIMEDPTRHRATLRLHPVLMVAEDPPSIRLRFQFMYWEDQDWENEGDGMVQEFSTAQARRLLDRLLVDQAMWV